MPFAESNESLPTNASKRFLDLLVHLARVKARVAQELVPLPVSTASKMEVCLLICMRRTHLICFTMVGLTPCT